MVQSPSWAADWLAASQEIPRISRNPKIHHRTHKGPPPVPILEQPNPVHMPTSHLLEIHPNIIHQSIPVPLITCFIRQFVRQMWPINLAFLPFMGCVIFPSAVTLCNISSFFTRSVQQIFYNLLQHHSSKLLLSEVSKLQHYTKQ